MLYKNFAEKLLHKAIDLGMTDAFSMPAEEFDEMMNDIQNN